MFYDFRQNSSGGSFDLDPEKGLGVHTLVEGSDRDDIIRRAEALGIYFDGCEKGIDCSCCGDRWNAPDYDDRLDAEPMIYGEPAAEYSNPYSGRSSGIWVHYMDGRKEEILPLAQEIE